MRHLPASSTALAILTRLHEHGPQTTVQLMEALHLQKASVIYQAVKSHSLIRIGRTYALTDAIKRWFDETHEPYVPDGVVPRRFVNLLHAPEMTGYAARLSQGRNLRPMAAMTTGVSPAPWRVPT